jgi:hypothetical protein
MKNKFKLNFIIVLFALVFMVFSAIPGQAAKLPKEIMVFASTDSITTWDPSASYSTYPLGPAWPNGGKLPAMG